MVRRPWFLALLAATGLLCFAVALLAQLRFQAADSRLPERGSAIERISGLERPVTVQLDMHGVPHVQTTNEHDLWFTEGYLHARERFFQMELARRTAEGRLAEVFGDPAVASDRRMLTLRLAATARRQAAELDPGDLFALEAYAEGVNTALDRWGRWIAPELGVLAVDPEPWRVEDSLAVGLLLELDLTNSEAAELRRERELAGYGRERAADLWGWSPQQAEAWIPPGEPPPLPRGDAPPLGEVAVGSNAWALGPSRTASGRPIVANDPHIGVAMPGTWYAIDLKGGEVAVAGASLAGVPGVLIGHTRRAAWGFTMAMLDDQDLFRLVLDEGGSRERVDGEWRPLQLITEEIPVRGRSEPEVLHLKVASVGPVVSERGGRALALAWTGLAAGSALGAFLRMDRAASVSDLEDAWDGVIGPAMMLVAADDGGHVLEQMVGLVPVRHRGFGRLPAPGDDTRWSWRGFRSQAATLRRLDPPEGFVVAANNDFFTAGDFPEAARFPAEFEPPWRERRIHARLAAGRGWDEDACLALQGDLTSLRAAAMLQLLRPDLERHPGPTARTLLGWNAQMMADDLAPHVYSRFVLELANAVGGDEARQAGLAATPFDAERLLRLLAGAMDPTWWDVVDTRAVETRDDVVAAALARVDGARLHRSWGRVHRVDFDHPFVEVPLLGPMLGLPWSRGPYPVGGDGVTVDAMYWSRRHPFGVTALPSMRFVTEVGNWDRTVLTLPVGESGRPWSPHYGDQATAWLRGAAVRLPFSEAAIAADREAELALEPRH